MAVVPKLKIVSADAKEQRAAVDGAVGEGLEIEFRGSRTGTLATTGEFTEPETPDESNQDECSCCFKCHERLGKPYHIHARVKDKDGNWGEFGPVLKIDTPPAPAPAA